MNTKTNDTEDFNEEHSILNAIPKQNNFKIPDAYFDQLPATLASKLATKKQTKKSKLIYLSIISAAAALALLFYTIPINKIPNSTSSTTTLSQESYTVEMIEIAFENQLAITEERSLEPSEKSIEEQINTISISDFTIDDLENSFYEEKYY